MIADRARVAAEQVGVEVERAGQVRRGGERQFRLAVHDIQVAREHGLAFLDDVHVRRAALLGREDPELNAIAGAIDGAFGAQQNLVRARASFEGHGARRAIAFLVAGLDVQRRGCRRRPAGGSRQRRLRRWSHSGRDSRRRGPSTSAVAGFPSGYEVRMKTWFSRLGIERAALGNRRDDQRRFADRDRFAARFGVAGGILHRGLNQHARRALAERPAGEVMRAA